MQSLCLEGLYTETSSTPLRVSQEVNRPASPRSIPRRPRLVPVSSDSPSLQSDEPGQRYVLHLNAEQARTVLAAVSLVRQAQGGFISYGLEDVMTELCRVYL